MADLIRTSIRLTEDMHEWYKREAEKIGIPMNALMIFALKQYQREEAIIPNLPNLFKAMEEEKGQRNTLK
ncbi:Uncharacterised protein [Mycobacteroides abscessus subsp. abscessus]|nr:Uncharacterised protein [Mycobacteroides abscessus subsp. abscessus]